MTTAITGFSSHEREPVQPELDTSHAFVKMQVLHEQGGTQGEVKGIFVERMKDQEPVMQAAIEYEDGFTVDVPLLAVPGLVAHYTEMQKNKVGVQQAKHNGVKKEAHVKKEAKSGMVVGSSSQQGDSGYSPQKAFRVNSDKRDRYTSPPPPPPPPRRALQGLENHLIQDYDGKKVAFSHSRGVFKEGLLDRAKRTFGGSDADLTVWSDFRGTLWRGDLPLLTSTGIPEQWGTLEKYARAKLTGIQEVGMRHLCRLNMTGSTQMNLLAEEEIGTVVMACGEVDLWVTSADTQFVINMDSGDVVAVGAVVAKSGEGVTITLKPPGETTVLVSRRITGEPCGSPTASVSPRKPETCPRRPTSPPRRHPYSTSSRSGDNRQHHTSPLEDKKSLDLHSVRRPESPYHSESIRTGWTGATAWTEATGVTGIAETRCAAWATSGSTAATGTMVTTGNSGVTGSVGGTGTTGGTGATGWLRTNSPMSVRSSREEVQDDRTGIDRDGQPRSDSMSRSSSSAIGQSHSGGKSRSRRTRQRSRSQSRGRQEMTRSGRNSRFKPEPPHRSPLSSGSGRRERESLINENKSPRSRGIPKLESPIHYDRNREAQLEWSCEETQGNITNTNRGGQPTEESRKQLSANTSRQNRSDGESRSRPRRKRRRSRSSGQQETTRTCLTNHFEPEFTVNLATGTGRWRESSSLTRIKQERASNSTSDKKRRSSATGTWIHPDRKANMERRRSPPRN